MHALPHEVGKLMLGRYRLVMPLAKGGQGAVYLARGEGAAGFARPVIIKQILTPIARDREAKERFVREARITAQLRHPDIVSILDFEQETDDSYVMVLEYVHGYDLGKWTRFLRLQNRPFDAELAACITIRVLEALHYTHSLRSGQGEPTPIIHRDVSPGNVLIDEEGHVKLTDFGIAHADLDRAEEQSSSKQRNVQGKLSYIAPELYRGAPPSPQTDLYAAALMLHQLLVGKNEFQAKDLVSSAMLSLQHVPTRVSSVRSDVSEAASDLIARALAKNPKQRPQSARELSTELRRAFSLDLGEMPERLSQAVQRDFFDPRFASLAEVTELAAIDRAWRELPATKPLSLPPAAPSASAAPAAADEEPLRADPTAAEKAPSKRESMVWLGLAAIAVAAAVAFVVTRTRGGGERVVFVDARAHADQALEDAPSEEPSAAPAQAEGKASHADPPDHASAQPKAQAAPTASRRPKDASLALTRRFGEKRRNVETCFNAHSGGLEGAPRIYVDFEISASGKVTHAGLAPQAIEDTPLGRCLLKVAQSTRFGEQSAPLQFRIPLTAHSE